MIRGPVLPQMRASVWSRLASRLDAIERGLTLVLEGVDCSAGQFGFVEGLARDATGAPVLVLVAVDGDGLLAARVHSACEFLARLGDALAAAVPEAELVPGMPGRVVVVGNDAAASSLDLLRRLPLPGLEVCRIETFRLAGEERFVVRWLAHDANVRGDAGGAAASGSARFSISDRRRGEWEELQQLCGRIDDSIRWDGDRFSQRISWQGRVLGRIEHNVGELWGIDAQDVRHALRSAGERRRFVDRLLRRYAALNGLLPDAVAPGAATAAAAAHASATDGGASHPAAEPSLRATLSSRLSAEEYSALGGPTSVGGAAAENDNVADDVARIVAPDPWGAASRPGGVRRTP